MNMPYSQPPVGRSGDFRAIERHPSPAGLSPQACDWIRCSSAILRCMEDPDPVRCIMDIAPNCRDCLP